MGFSLGGAITGALGGFLVGGPAGAVIGGGVGGFAGGKGGKEEIKFAQIPETEEAKAARARLFEMAEGPLPEIPRRGVAPLKPMGEERELARETAKELIQPQDFFSLPEVQGILQETTARGDLLANRLGRMLQASGNITSSPGRDVLGRAVTDVQKSIASSLAPFAMEERARRTGMIGVLEGLGLTEEERRRGVSQAELDALFSQEMTEAELPLTFRAPLLQSIIGLQPGTMAFEPQQRPSSITEFAPLIGPLLGSVLGGGGGGGGLTMNQLENPWAYG